MVKVYGMSDDLCEIEGSKYEFDEIGCYDSTVEIGFTDGTRILVGYPKRDDLGVWEIEIIEKGYARSQLTECFDENADIYSDIFEIEAEVSWHKVSE